MVLAARPGAGCAWSRRAFLRWAGVMIALFDGGIAYAGDAARAIECIAGGSCRFAALRIAVAPAGDGATLNACCARWCEAVGSLGPAVFGLGPGRGADRAAPG